MVRSVSDEAFKIQKYFMTKAGVWPIENPTFLYNCYGFFMTVLIQNLFILPSLLLFLDTIDLSRGPFIIYCNIAAICYQMKVAGFCLSRQTFAKILKDLEQPLFKTHEKEYDEIVNQAVVLANRITGIMYIPSIFFGLLLGIFPVFDHSTKRPLPFPTPYDVEQIPYFVYLLIYFGGAASGAIATITNTNMDTSACGLMILGTAQLKVLGEKLRNLVRSTSQQSTMDELENYGMLDDLIIAKVQNCVKHHIAIIEYLENVEDIFTYQLLAQFIASLFLICTSAFSFVVIPVTDVMFATSVSFFTIATIEIAIYCIFGNQIIVESSNIRDCCYMSEWNQCGPKVCKALFTMMERTKRPVVLTAGKFAELSHESLIAILKSSFSYFLLMQKLYGENASK